MGMSMRSRKELTRAVARRYRLANRKMKGDILDEFCAATGYARSYAATLLRNYGLEKVVAQKGGSKHIVTTKTRRRGGGESKAPR